MKSGILLSLVLLLGVQGCSSIVHGTTQELQITTAPPGARATVGTQSCVTPCKLTVKRDEQNLRVEKGSYKKTFDMEKDFNFGATICGNILWIVPGAVVDLATGGAWEIRPINLKLNASGEQQP
jgi:hypothetical protein